MADYQEPYVTLRMTGLSYDTPSYDLPLDVWSEGKNVRFVDGKTVKFKGHRSVFGTPNFSPLWFHPVGYGSEYYWVYATEDEVAVTDMTNHYDITPTSAPTGNVDTNWNGGLINNILVMNNGVDAPIWWTGSPSNVMTALTGWPASTLAACIRPYKSYLVAMNISDGSGDYPDAVRWSDAAVPGTIPSSWNISDPTKDAGETYLSDTPGEVIDGLSLGDSFIIYKRYATYQMQYVGGQYIHNFRKLFDNIGIMAPNCVAAVDRRHLVLTTDDLILHDGSTYQSILDSKMRAWLFNSISPAYYQRSFLMPHHTAREIWVCVPVGDSEYANLALVWNYRTDKIGLRELPNIRHAAPGVVDPGESTAWDDDSDVWDIDDEPWNSRSYSPTASSILFGDPTGGFLEADKTDSFDGEPMESYVARTSMPLLQDYDNLKLVKGVYPRMSSSSAALVYVRVGGQMNATDPIDWGSEMPFTIGVDSKVDCLVKGRFLSLMFRSESDVNWELNSFDIDVEKVERR